MDSSVLISVIIPVYNVEEYLSRCINSIINQTYRNLEIILVDDGSTDNCSKICDVYSKKDSRIKVFHKKNGGLSDARNYGIDKSNGSYLSFIDSDDYVHEKFIEVLYHLAYKTNLPISIVGFKEFSQGTVEKTDVKVEYEVIDCPKAMEYLFSNEKYCNYAWNKLYKRELFEKVRYPVGRNMEDLGTTYLLFDQCSGVAYTSEKLYFYFQRPGSIIHTINIKHFEDRMVLAHQRFLYMKRKYPKMRINDVFITNVLLESYSELIEFININDISNEIVTMISKKVFLNLTIPRKIRFIIFVCSRKLYLKVVKKKC